MALITLAGQGPYWPTIPPFAFGSGSTMLNRTAAVIDATGEKYAISGRYWNAARSTKSIRKIGLLPGTIVSAGGSVLTWSLQGVSATAGPPIQPDETQDQTVAVNATALTSNTFHLSGNLSADRSTAFGELLSVVAEFDGGGRLGADSVAFSQWSRSGATRDPYQFAAALKTGGAWALSVNHPIVLFENSDGTFATLSGCWPTSAVTLITLNSGTTPDEFGLEFQVTAPIKVDGAWLVMFITTNAALDVVLYEGATAMTNGTVSIDNNQLGIADNYRALEVDFADLITLQPSTTYRLIAKPTTATDIFLPSLDVSAAGHMACVPGGGAAWNSASRTDGGSFTALTTRRPFMGIRLAAFDDAVSAGGEHSAVF